MPIQRCRNIGRASDARPHTYVGEHPAENKHIEFHGVSERESALMMFDKHANLKYKFGNRHFWSEGYCVSTVARSFLFKNMISNLLC